MFVGASEVALCGRPVRTVNRRHRRHWRPSEELPVTAWPQHLVLQLTEPLLGQARHAKHSSRHKSFHCTPGLECQT